MGLIEIKTRPGIRSSPLGTEVYGSDPKVWGCLQSLYCREELATYLLRDVKDAAVAVLDFG